MIILLCKSVNTKGDASDFQACDAFIFVAHDVPLNTYIINPMK